MLFRSDQDKTKTLKEKKELEVVGSLKWPECFGQDADNEYPVYKATMDAVLSQFPNVPDPDDAIADFLRYHRAHDTGPHYPTGPDTVGASFVFWLQHRKPKPVPKRTRQDDDGAEDPYVVNKPKNEEEDWARLCSILAEDRAAGLPVDCLLDTMAERWPGREVPA